MDQVLKKWVDLFNKSNAEALGELYHEDATMHQTVYDPVTGKENIKKMLSAGFKLAKLKCIPESIFEDGNWSILEWKDSNGLRGCGFFHIVNNKIAFQRGYWDNLKF